MVVEEGAILRLAGGVRVDAWELEALIAALPEPPALDDLEVLASELLPDWRDPWVALHRERLRDLAVRGLDACRAAAGGDRDRVWRVDAATLSLDPLRDSCVRGIIECHLAEGNYAAALRAYHILYRRLKEDLGVEPSAATTALVAPMVGSQYWKRLEGRPSPWRRRRRR